MRKKLLSILALALLSIGSAWADTAIISKNLGTDGAAANDANSITGQSGSAAVGFTIAITSNTTKTYQNGADITYNNTAYKSLKNSNGATNTITCPSGKVATSIDFYIIPNTDGEMPKLTNFDGTACNDEATTTKDGTKPTKISKTINNKNTFTFVIGNKQANFIAVVTYTDAPSDFVADPVVAFSNNAASISCSTTGAKIYYTTDGTAPTTTSNLYSTNVELTNSCTIRAKAFNGENNEYSSNIVDANCFVNNSQKANYLATLKFNGGTTDGYEWTSTEDSRFTITSSSTEHANNWVHLSGTKDAFKLSHTDAGYTLAVPSDVRITKIAFVGKSLYEGYTGTVKVTDFNSNDVSSFLEYPTDGTAYVSTIEFTPDATLAYGSPVTFVAGGCQSAAYIELFGEIQTYGISYNEIANGSIAGVASSREGTTVTVTATPNSGYELTALSIYKASDDTDVTDDCSVANNTFVMPGFAVKVGASFSVLQTYTATYANGGHGTAPNAEEDITTVTLGSISGVDFYTNSGWIADRDVIVDDATVTAGTTIASGKTAKLNENTTFTAQWTQTNIPYVEGITFPANQPSTALDLTADLSGNSKFTLTSGYAVCNPNDFRNNATWETNAAGSAAGMYWNVASGSIFSGSPSAKTNCLKLQTGVTAALKFTGTTEFKALMNSRKNNNTVKALLVDCTGTPSRVGAIKEMGNKGGDNKENAYPTLGDDAIVTFSNLNASHTYIVFFYGFDTSTTGMVYQVAFKTAPSEVTATINSTYGIASFSSTYPLDFTNVEGLTAWRVAAEGNTSTDKVNLTQVTGKVAANTGLIVMGSTANIPVTDSGTEYTGDANKLFACDGSWSEVGVNSNGTNFVLTVQDNKVVFAPVTDANHTATLAAGQAALWLSVTMPTTARGLSLVFGEETTGVSDATRLMNNDESIKNGEVYNLSGQRVAQPSQGIYIIDGKKVIIK